MNADNRDTWKEGTPGRSWQCGEQGGRRGAGSVPLSRSPKVSCGLLARGWDVAETERDPGILEQEGNLKSVHALVTDGETEAWEIR